MNYFSVRTRLPACFLLLLSLVLLPFFNARAQEEQAPDFAYQVSLPYDPMFSTAQSAEGGDVRWIKFAIVLSEPQTVYFQNSSKYLFHYDFAIEHLAAFKGMTRAEFDTVSLRATNQQVVLGAVLMPFDDRFPEYAIQFVGLDPLPKESVRDWFQLVASKIALETSRRAFYIPTFEQTAVAVAERAYFESNGITVASADRWVAGDQRYSAGWALGRLRYIPAAEIPAAYGDGRLTPTDILLTDVVPAEVPFVAGIISLAPSTPNSHVAIQAQSFQIPFVYQADAEDRAATRALEGKEVILRAAPGRTYGKHQIKVIEGRLGQQFRAELLQSKIPAPLAITPKEHRGRIAQDTAKLTPADMRYFGGKAANFGLLRRTIPDHSPAAIAFSFDVWDDFMSQTLPSGKRLRREIRDRLAGFTYPPDNAALRTVLTGIRELVKDGEFTNDQKQAIIQALSGFSQDARIRFRSSTNMEDGDQFSGAGLYDSYSGCLSDDLDGDSIGPSHCDPDEPEERGVFRAMRKVFASFYNENAFLERLRHGVQERQVGMALLVHHSFPDEIELANGVATVKVPDTSAPQMKINLVTQSGAVSVSNPDTSAQPELVRADRFGPEVYLTLEQRSSLIPLGDYVMDWESDYRVLAGLLMTVAKGYRQLFPEKTRLLLDLEYKKTAAGLVVKQVRPIPRTPAAAQYLVDAGEWFCIRQGEHGDVFSNHRLKSRWKIETRNMRITLESLAQPFYRRIQGERVQGGEVVSFDEFFTNLPEATHVVRNSAVVDRWTEGTGSNMTRWRLRTQPDDYPAGTIATLADAGLELRVDYTEPQPKLPDPGGGDSSTTTLRDQVLLVPCGSIKPSTLVERTFTRPSGVTIQTKFFWPERPTGFTAGYTAPLAAWRETIITGFTTAPIVLRSAYAQTYRPGHHNFSEDFVFEPRLEEGLPQEQLDELIAANIRLIVVQWQGEVESPMKVLGFDDQLRNLP